RLLPNRLRVVLRGTTARTQVQARRRQQLLDRLVAAHGTFEHSAPLLRLVLPGRREPPVETVALVASEVEDNHAVQGTRMIDPVVLRASSSRCASAASRNAK